MLPSASRIASCGALKPCIISRVAPVFRSITCTVPVNQLDRITSSAFAVALIGYSSVTPSACIRAGSLTSPVAPSTAIGEYIGDVDGVLAGVGNHGNASGQRQLADDDLFGCAGFGIDLLDPVVRHVGHKDLVLVVDRQIVERGF